MQPPASDLISLSYCKSALSITATTGDTMLANLISAASRFFLSATNRRTIGLATFLETRDGDGSDSIILRYSPIYSLLSLKIDGIPIVPAALGVNTTPGYYLPDNGFSVRLIGPRFNCGRANVLINYIAGYGATQTDPLTVPASPGPYTLTAAQGQFFYSDLGVTLANGTPLTPTTGAPGPMQYAVSSVGVYTFNAAQAGVAVLISYNYSAIPFDIQDAIAQIVAFKKAKYPRIDQVSAHLGTETVTFSQADVPPMVRPIIATYKTIAQFRGN